MLLLFSFAKKRKSVWNIQVIAQLELWKERATGKYEKKVYVLPKHLDEKVAALHLGKLGAKLTKLTPAQAEYISVPVEGPYKPAPYRYWRKEERNGKSVDACLVLGFGFPFWCGVVFSWFGFSAACFSNKRR